MEFKERILTAMNHEEPDQVPTMGLILDQSTVNQVLGLDTVDIVGMLRNPETKDVVVQMMSDESSRFPNYYQVHCGVQESAIKLGFDANWSLYAAYMQLVHDTQTPIGYVFHDAFGRVWEFTSDEKSNMLLNFTRPLCETEEKWEGWVESKSAFLDKVIEEVGVFHKKVVEDFGDRIMPIGYAAPGIFENSWQPIGFVNFTRFIFEKPDFIKRVIKFHSDLYMRYLEQVMDSDVEIVLTGDDLAQKTGPMLRPEMIEDLFGESYRRVAEAVHKRNKKLIFHSCGNIYQLLDKFIEWGFDGILTLEPTAGMDLGEVREHVGHKLVLVGNLDVSYLLVRGTRQEIEDAVKKAINDAARGGGYILSTSHSHSAVDANRLRWMVETAHEYGKYPIGL